MFEVFRTLAVHQAKFHKTLLDSWGLSPGLERVLPLMIGLLYDGIWLTKFPLLFAPTFGIQRLSALEKTQRMDGFEPAFVISEILSLRRLVDADVLRFVLTLKSSDLETRVELFFGGRAMNKPLWQYLAAWFEHDAVLRATFGTSPGLLETVFE